MSDEANTHKADKIIPIVPSIKGIRVSDNQFIKRAIPSEDLLGSSGSFK